MTREDNKDLLEEFLSGRSLDPDELGDPPLAGGEDPLLTRNRVSLGTDESVCHWSPFCSREGERYIPAQINGESCEVWTCDQCRPSTESTIK